MTAATPALAPSNEGERCNEVSCAHCGLPVPHALMVDGATRQFCCGGCETVYDILHVHGLGSYYSLPEKRKEAVHSTDRSYEEFDHPAFSDLYVTALPGGECRIELHLEGVHCSSCVWLIEKIPLLLDGVTRAELNIRRSLARIEWSPAAVPLSAIARQLDRLGYRPHPWRGARRSEIRRREDRTMLVRIGVAGAIAANIMLLALALYAGEASGMEANYERFFRWMSLVLIIPTFVWPGRLFFTGASAALRTRTLHMDLPIAIALSAGLVRGAINTLTDSGPIYFDGLALLVFALLTGRFLQLRGQRMANDSAELMHSLVPATARVVDEEYPGSDTAEEESPVTQSAPEGSSRLRLREIPSEAVVPGMLLEVRAGDLFAGDGTVASGESKVNLSLLTGESAPIDVKAGDSVYAGTLNVESPLRVRIEKAGEGSRLSLILKQVEESSIRRAPVVLMANRLAGIFVAVVLTLAVLTFAIRSIVAPGTALDDAIALLIVTCPCALALATPLAITVATGRAAQRQILVKGGDALELLSRPGTIALDKTGTLTEGRVAVVEWLGDDEIKPLVLALERGSSHPIADGFRRSWDGIEYPEAAQVNSRPGKGLEGVVRGHRVRIGSERFVLEEATDSRDILGSIGRFDRTLTRVFVAVDGTVEGVAGMGDGIRDDAREALDGLRSRGWKTLLLSGDSTDVAHAVGVRLGFAQDEIIGGATPEDKLAQIEEIRSESPKGSPVVMVGDGVNDAAAIAAADVGISVHSGAEVSLSTSDIYLARPGLGPLVELIDGAGRTMNVIRRNVIFSIAYNIVGAGLAMAGVLTPLIAAILMPSSSITVVLASWLSRTFPKGSVR